MGRKATDTDGIEKRAYFPALGLPERLNASSVITHHTCYEPSHLVKANM